MGAAQGGYNGPMTSFMFATGIENSYPTIQLPDGTTKRVDEMEKCGHYARWRDDFRLVRELGIDYLRYGPPLYRTHLGPGRYDWGFADETFGALQEMGITPIADLCHFGVPDWIGGLRQPGLAGAVRRVRPRVRRRASPGCATTPRSMRFSSRRRSPASSAGGTSGRRATAGLSRRWATCAGPTRWRCRRFWKSGQTPIFIQSESSEYFHAADPGVMAQANVLNEKRFLSLDLTYGRPVNAVMYEYLLDNGMTRDEYHWFLKNQVKTNCVMGNDYYITNEHLVHEDGRVTPSGEIFGYYVITRQYYQRYRLPVMHTETNLSDAENSWDWLWKQWMNLFRLRSDGVPIIGFTWYSLTDQVDWDTALREDAGRVNPVGLCDLDRNIRRVG